jgi:hypothetical protein
MTRAAWIKWGIYASAAIAGICAAIFPVAAPILVPVATGLTGLATKTPGDPALTSDVHVKPTTLIEPAPKDTP